MNTGETIKGKFSRAKGWRGENEVVHLLPGAKRTGYAGTRNPDVTTPFAVYSVKNTRTPVSLKKVLAELELLERQDLTRHHLVAVKVNHIWLAVELFKQHGEDHYG